MQSQRCGRRPAVSCSVAFAGRWLPSGLRATRAAGAGAAVADAGLRLKPRLARRGLQGVGIEQKLNQQVPLNLIFRDEAGRTVPLSTYFAGSKPVMLALVYYTCPMLCTLILNGVESSLRAVSFNPGQDFEVVAVSFDPERHARDGRRQEADYLQRYGRPNTANGWHFLTGDEADYQGADRCRRLPL